MLRGSRSVRALLSGVVLLAILVGLMPAPKVSAAGERWCPPQTHYCSENAFYDFWRANGGLEVIGYPIDAPRRFKDGLIRQVYERAVLEWHPEQAVQYQVLLTRLGADFMEGQQVTKQQPIPCSTNCNLFPETNHTLRDTFRDYWLAYGGLAVFGFPLTEQVQERNAADGKVYTVQYFERNRFEYHPENQGRYRVLLGRLGGELLEQNRADITKWPVAQVPNYGGAVATPPPVAPSAIAVAVAPDAAPAGSIFTLTISGLPAGAQVRASRCQGYCSFGEAESTVFQLPPNETTLRITISTRVQDTPTENFILLTVNGINIDERGRFTVTPVRAGVPPISAYICPAAYPIKGNLTTYNGEKIYHVPGGQFYDETKPEVCFNSEADAQIAGFRRSQR